MDKQSNRFTRSFFEDLFLEFPDWEKLYQIIPEQEQVNRIEVVVQSPKNKDIALWIYTYPNDEVNEITVGFDEYHCHFSYESDEKVISDAIGFIKDIIEERVAVVIGAENGCMISRTITISEMIPNQNERVRSWKGTYDRN